MVIQKGKITVIDDQRNKSTEQELSEDLLSIVHIYCCRQMGKRSYKGKTIQKSLKIKLKLNLKQKEIINKWIHTSNYVYNKTIEAINKGHKPNFYDLRDLLVTKNTKKNHELYQQQQNKIN